MIKVNVWYGWQDVAETYTLKEFENIINGRYYDVNNIRIEFIVE